MRPASQASSQSNNHNPSGVAKGKKKKKGKAGSIARSSKQATISS